MDALKKEYGPDMGKWKWGRIHKLNFNHILGQLKPLDRIFNLGPFPIGGDSNTIAAASMNYCNLDPCPTWGPPFRFIADLNDIEHCLGILVPGQSGNLASKHYRDGVKAWMEGEYHPMLFARKEVEQNLEGRMIFRPKMSE